MGDDGWQAALSWGPVGGTQQRCVELGRSVGSRFDPPTANRGATPTTFKKDLKGYTAKLAPFEPLPRHTYIVVPQLGII